MENKRIIKYILICIILASCSVTEESSKDKKKFEESILNRVESKWFNGAKRFSLVDKKDEAIEHLFYDINPDLDVKLGKTNFVIETPARSKNQYRVDLTSGQHYYRHAFCPQEDHYGNYKKEIYKPNYSEGYIPRILDQLGFPQKVIAFGNDRFISEHYKTNYFTGKIVGAYRETICPYKRCVGGDTWLSRLVLVVVPQGSEYFDEIDNFEQLKEFYNWKYAKAFARNGKGHSKIGNDYFQIYKIEGEIPTEDALRYLIKRSSFFNLKKLKKMRVACYKLYDHIWKQLSVMSLDDIPAKNSKELNQKIKKRRQTSDVFHKKFVKIVQKYGDEYSTCSNYVYPANINYSSDRHWLFTHLTGFTLLNKLGEYYYCDRNIWSRGQSGKGSRGNQFGSCTKKDIQNALDQIPFRFSERRKLQLRSYRFIDYDSHSNGSHKKMYSWVPWNKNENKCIDPNTKKVKLLAFPEDVRWNKLPKNSKSKGFLGEIIY